MTGIVAAIVLIFSAWNPFSTPRLESSSRRDRVLGTATGAAIVALLAAATDPILSLLSVSVPTLRTAAGAVIALFGARWAIGPAPHPLQPDDAAAALVTAVAITTPPTVLAAMAVTGQDGWLIAAIALALTLSVALVIGRATISGSLAGLVRRATGGIAVAVGIALVFAGIRSV